MTQATDTKKRAGNHYAIVSFYPGAMTDKTLLLFKNGRHWNNLEKESYIIWFFTQQHLFVDDINLNASLQDCQELRRQDEYVDWHSVNRGYFKHLVSIGELEVLEAEQ